MKKINSLEMNLIRLALHHLAVIKSLGGTGSVSATARDLGLTQSAISHRMKEAERRVGSSLFFRDGHSISLNPAGRRLLQSADRILSEVAMAERDLGRLSSGFNDTIRIGAACYAGFGWYPPLFDLMRQEMPKVSLEIVSEISEDPVVLLNNNQADIVLAATPVLQNNIQSTSLIEDQLVAVLPVDHPLASKDYLDPEDFEKEIFVTHHTLPETGREYEKIFKPNGIMPRQVISAGRSQAVMEMILNGLAVTVLPKLAVQEQAARMGLPLRPLGNEGMPIHWYALVRSKPDDNSLVAQVLDYVQQSMQIQQRAL